LPSTAPIRLGGDTVPKCRRFVTLPICAPVLVVGATACRRIRLKKVSRRAAACAAVAIVAGVFFSACGEDPRAVYDAVERGDLAEVKRLVERGAPLDWSPENGLGPLHKAAEDGRVDIAAYLLEQGADVNAKAVDGITPLHIVQDASLTERLIQNGARVEALSETLGTPLNAAILSGLYEVAKVLIAHGAEIDARDARRSTPLYYASGRGDLEAVHLLLSKGADVNAANAPGFRPLHWAAGNGHLEVVRLLLANGARADVAGANGRTPLDMAVIGDHQEVAALLRSAH
jgi:ankyrin repeat protein